MSDNAVWRETEGELTYANTLSEAALLIGGSSCYG